MKTHNNIRFDASAASFHSSPSVDSASRILSAVLELATKARWGLVGESFMGESCTAPSLKRSDAPDVMP